MVRILLSTGALAVLVLFACVRHTPLAPSEDAGQPRCIAWTKTSLDGETLVLSVSDFYAPAGSVAPYDLEREVGVQPDGHSLVAPSLEAPLWSLSDSQRARLLQLAVHVANNIQRTDGGTPKVMVLVPGACSFDFSHHQGESATDAPDSKPFDTHPDADAFHATMHPKLFIGRSNVAVKGESHGTPPELWYAGPGVDGRGHGRVVVLSRSGLVNVRLGNFTVRGDHSWAHARDPAYYLHENSSGLVTGDQDRRSWYGAIMVGLSGGRNDVTLEDLDVVGVNRAGVAIVGNANINRVSVTGILPELVDQATTRTLVDIREVVAPTMPDVGYGFDTGIAQQGAYGAVTVTNSSFSRVVEGITGGGVGVAHWWDVRSNRFTEVGDHGIYILGRLWTSSFVGNQFTRMLGAALKFGDSCGLEPWAHVTEAESSADAPSAEGMPCGAYRITIAFNRFELLRRGALILSGMLNVVSNNEVAPYSRALDVTKDKAYDPRSGTSAGARRNVMPDVWLGTDGGQASNANHAAFNDFAGNSKGSEAFTIFITQHPNVPDRSVAFNRIRGEGQIVYFNPATDSSYAPAVVVSGATLRVGAPEDCSDCQPGRADHRLSVSDIAVQPAFARSLMAAVDGQFAPQVFVRFGEDRDLFVIGENGLHRRIARAVSTVSIHATADLDADGSEELYFEDGSGALLGRRLGSGDLGARAAGTPLDLAAGSWEYAPSVPVEAEVAHLIPMAPAELATVFAGESSIYGTGTSDGNPVRGSTIYTIPAGSRARLLRAADLSPAGETKGKADELYVALSGGPIVGVYRAREAWKSQEVYNGRQLVSFMEPAHTGRRKGCRETEVKQRMYQGFGGSQVFETAPSAGDFLPMFGRTPFPTGAQRWESALAADLDGDGAEELVGLLASEHEGLASATLSCDVDHADSWQVRPLRLGSNDERAMGLTTAGDRVLSFVDGSPVVWLLVGRGGTAINYFDWIRERMRGN